MEIIFVRHGEINSNTCRVYSGISEEPLNNIGLIQAANVAQKLKNANISHLYCGPLLRVLETARYIGNEVGIKPVIIEAFNELVMGPWEGLSEDAVAKKFPNEWKIWNNSPASLQMNGRETLAQLQERALGGVSEILAYSSGAKRICVVSHVAVIRVLLLFAERRSLNDYKKIDVPNAKPILLNFSENRIF